MKQTQHWYNSPHAFAASIALVVLCVLSLMFVLFFFDILGPTDAAERVGVGYIYNETTGAVLTGARIAVAGPGAVTMTDDGFASGAYDFTTDGTTGTYYITVYPPDGFSVSGSCSPSTTSFDPTVTTTITLGSGLTGANLTDSTCTANPYYFKFYLTTGDPQIQQNNIRLTPVTATCSRLGNFLAMSQTNGVISEYTSAGALVGVFNATHTPAGNFGHFTVTGEDGMIFMANTNSNTIERYHPHNGAWLGTFAVSNTFENIRDIAYSNGVFYTVGAAGTAANQGVWPISATSGAQLAGRLDNLPQNFNTVSIGPNGNIFTFSDGVREFSSSTGITVQTIGVSATFTPHDGSQNPLSTFAPNGTFHAIYGNFGTWGYAVFDVINGVVLSTTTLTGAGILNGRFPTSFDFGPDGLAYIAEGATSEIATLSFGNGYNQAPTALNVITAGAGDQKSVEFFALPGCYDYGDASDPTYPTLSGSSGAAHIPIPSMYLGQPGQSTDVEATANQSANADGDDTTGSDDDSGVTIAALLIPGTTSSLSVVASENGMLSAWIDWNADGDWDDANENILAGSDVGPGTSTYTLTIPDGLTNTTTIARFRYYRNTSSLPSYTGTVVGGEVEDYQVTVQNTSVVSGTVWLDADRDNVIDGTETLLNNVTLSLFDAGADTTCHTGDDTFASSTVTDVSGLYAFSTLASSTYCVFVTDTNSVLTNYTLGFPTSSPTTTVVLTASSTVTGTLFGYVTAPELSITTAVSSASASPGDSIVFTHTYANNGFATSTNVVVTHTVPTGVTFSTVGSGGTTWSCADASTAGTNCTVTIASLPPATTSTLSYGVTVLSSFAGTITSPVTIGDDGTNGTEADYTNNTATGTITVTSVTSDSSTGGSPFVMSTISSGIAATDPIPVTTVTPVTVTTTTDNIVVPTTVTTPEDISPSTPVAEFAPPVTPSVSMCQSSCDTLNIRLGIVVPDGSTREQDITIEGRTYAQVQDHNTSGQCQDEYTVRFEDKTPSSQDADFDYNDVHIRVTRRGYLLDVMVIAKDAAWDHAVYAKVLRHGAVVDTVDLHESTARAARTGERITISLQPYEDAANTCAYCSTSCEELTPSLYLVVPDGSLRRQDELLGTLNPVLFSLSEQTSACAYIQTFSFEDLPPTSLELDRDYNDVIFQLTRSGDSVTVTPLVKNAAWDHQLGIEILQHGQPIRREIIYRSTESVFRRKNLGISDGVWTGDISSVVGQQCAN